MKKFIAVFDGYKISKSTLAYAQELAYTANAHLVGVFLDEIIYRSYSISKVYKKYEKPEEVIKQLDEKDKKKRDEAVRQFEQSCGKAKINFSVRRDKSIALQELKHESMFADLIIISEHETFTRYKQKPPTRFMKDLLADVQCPVLIVPGIYKPIDKITLLYDGGPSSLYAVKMFSYLLGDYNEAPVEVFTVKSAYLDNLHLPDNKLMREFIKRHFPKADYKVVKGDPEEQVVGYLRNHKENELVVLGAYRRSELSRWFKTSMADILMRELDTPLFIAHNK
jgi:nucleotide-binding universal stress UspA family protein